MTERGNSQRISFHRHILVVLSDITAYQQCQVQNIYYGAMAKHLWCEVQVLHTCCSQVSMCHQQFTQSD